MSPVAIHREFVMENENTTSSQFPPNLLIFKGEIYVQWVTLMNVIFKFQDLSEIMNNGVLKVLVNSDEDQQAVHKEQSKKDRKFLFLIHQCVYPNVFENIIEEESTKGAWDKLKNQYEGDEKLKSVKLQTLRKQFEITQVKEDEPIADLFSRLALLMNHMKVCGESTIGLLKIERMLRSLTANFD